MSGPCVGPGCVSVAGYTKTQGDEFEHDFDPDWVNNLEIDTDLTGDPEVGEIIIHGPNVMMGYALEQVDLARGAEIDELHTGDLARQAADGLWEITGRAKHFFSIHRKMVNRGVSFDAMHDLFGVRIITKSKADCYRALGVLHDIHKPVPERFKDYIATPKTNLYQSLHTTVIGPDGTVLPAPDGPRIKKALVTTCSQPTPYWAFRVSRATVTLDG
mgnify:CR=1 FL=1